MGLGREPAPDGRLPQAEGAQRLRQLRDSDQGLSFNYNIRRLVKLVLKDLVLLPQSVLKIVQQGLIEGIILWLLLILLPAQLDLHLHYLLQLLHPPVLLIDLILVLRQPLPPRPEPGLVSHIAEENSFEAGLLTADHLVCDFLLGGFADVDEVEVEGGEEDDADEAECAEDDGGDDDAGLDDLDGDGDLDVLVEDLLVEVDEEAEEDADHVEGEEDEVEDEEAVVALADAVVEVGAVVVEDLDAAVAGFAVGGAEGAPDFAGFAEFALLGGRVVVQGFLELDGEEAAVDGDKEGGTRDDAGVFEGGEGGEGVGKEDHG